jgi:hypothetical protein
LVKFVIIFPVLVYCTKKNLATLNRSPVMGNLCMVDVVFALLGEQRPLFNNMGLPPGVKFAPRGELCPIGEMFTPLFTPRGESTLLFRRIEGRSKELHTWGPSYP